MRLSELRCVSCRVSWARLKVAISPQAFTAKLSDIGRILLSTAILRAQPSQVRARSNEPISTRSLGRSALSFTTLISVSAFRGSQANMPSTKCGYCSVAGHVPTLPWVRSRVWVRVGLGSGLATGKGWVGTWPVLTRFDPKIKATERLYAVSLAFVVLKRQGFLLGTVVVISCNPITCYINFLPFRNMCNSCTTSSAVSFRFQGKRWIVISSCTVEERKER